MLRSAGEEPGYAPTIVFTALLDDSLSNKEVRHPEKDPKETTTPLRKKLRRVIDLGVLVRRVDASDCSVRCIDELSVPPRGIDRVTGVFVRQCDDSVVSHLSTLGHLS